MPTTRDVIYDPMTAMADTPKRHFKVKANFSFQYMSESYLVCL